MEPSWSDRFLNSNGQKKASPIFIAFIAFQLLLIIVIIVSVSQISDDRTAKNDAERYERMPELTIKDLAKKAPGLSEDDIADIQKKVFKIASENNSNMNADKIEAVIRGDKFYKHSFNKQTLYLHMTIDIPELQQSYDVIYGSNAVLDPEVATFVLCLDDEEVIYKDFKCKSSDSESIRDEIVPRYLQRFGFEYYTAYIDSNNPKTVIISPSATYENSEETKAAYIKEVKDSIDSLGISSERYNYYVRTAADVNYENQD